MRVLVMENVIGLDLDEVCAARKLDTEIEVIMNNGITFHVSVDPERLEEAWDIFINHWSENPSVFLNPKQN